jgi:hypothetical protein
MIRRENEIKLIIKRNQRNAEEFSDMGTMIKNEEVIKKACESFKNRLLTMATFGEQVIEY